VGKMASDSVFINPETLDFRKFPVFDPTCSLGVIRHGRPLGEPVQIASGSGETDDVRFEFQINCKNRDLTGNIHIIAKNGDIMLFSSSIKTVLPSEPDGIISIWKVEEKGIIRDVLMITQRSTQEQPGSLDLFAGETGMFSGISLGGELQNGYISIIQFGADV
jgi:hypothetical protein